MMKRQKEREGQYTRVIDQSPTESYGAFATVWRPGRLRKRHKEKMKEEGEQDKEAVYQTHWLESYRV